VLQNSSPQLSNLETNLKDGLAGVQAEALRQSTQEIQTTNQNTDDQIRLAKAKSLLEDIIGAEVDVTSNRIGGQFNRT